MKSVGERIKLLRKSKNMTLEQLGEKVGVGKSTVRKWENGIISNMRQDKIAKLADALDTTPAYLMGWEESDKESNLINQMSVNDLQEIADEFHISKTDLEKYIKLANQWNTEVGEMQFSDDEMTELINFAKFLISKRK